MTCRLAVRRGIVRLAGLAVGGALSLLACAGPQPQAVGQHLLGKSRDYIVACAGQPKSVSEADGLTILTYYKEATILEEEFPQSKSTFPKIHHGCWARLGLQGGQVVGVEYENVPSSYEDYTHCEAIFESCH
ncbi:hypothetical protein [Nitrospira sp. Kam-Ns4a]